MLPFLKEFWAFLRTRKKYWLLPILIGGGALALSVLLPRFWKTR